MNEPDWTAKVVALLASRGIEATPTQVDEWAGLMVKRWNEGRHKKSTTTEQWLRAVCANFSIPTMCLHLHFGDAADNPPEPQL